MSDIRNLYNYMTKIISPFRVKDGDIIEAYKREGGGVFEFADTLSGEVSLFEKQVKSKRVIVDRGNYVKLFKGSYSLVHGLSANSLRLFLFICFHVGVHSETIIFSYESVSKFCGFKRTVYYQSVSDLLDKQVIARKGSNEYFVNPNYVFNGSRLKLK